jgi:hypothetical protein
MKIIRGLAAFAFFAALPLTSQAQMFKCQVPGGRFAYQDAPCQDNAKQEVLKVDKKGVVKVDPAAAADANRTEPAPYSRRSQAREPGHSTTDDSASATATAAPDSTDKSNDANQVARPKVVSLICALVFVFGSWIWLLFRIGRISVLGAVFCFFFGIFSLYFLFAYWNDENNIKTPFFVTAISWLIFFGIVASVARPDYDEYVKTHKQTQSHSSDVTPGVGPAR